MQHHTRGFSMLGMLITLVCIVILFAIGMNAMNKAITGQGSAVPGTVRSVQDEMYLRSIHTGMVVAGNDLRDSRFPVPSLIANSNDWSLNTTANLYSSMIAGNYISEMLISGNEYSPFVDRMVGYNFNAYQPQGGIYWDTAFKADLNRQSHVSFAHMPLFGERYRRGWQANFDRQAVLVGNRGPKDGIDDSGSYSYGRSGVWGGHVLHGDGTIQFTYTFTMPGLTFERDGAQHADNIFAMETGADGTDAILSFTSEMTPRGPVLQFD
jgi:hypothetical protein